jgi:hypothetical protein
LRANRSWVKQFAELQVENQLLKQRLKGVKELVEKWRGSDYWGKDRCDKEYCATELEEILNKR